MCQEQPQFCLEYSELNCLSAEGHCIYKGNSEQYKGKIRIQDISVFGPKQNLLGYIRWFAAFLRS